MIVYPNNLNENNLLKQWITERVKDYRPNEKTYCVSVIRDDKIAAVVAWDNYRVTDIEVSIASDNPRWATRQTITMLLAYPFIQLSTQRVTAMIHKSNKKSRRFVEGIGFRLEGKHRHAGANLETIFSYGMTRQDYILRYGEKVGIKIAA